MFIERRKKSAQVFGPRTWCTKKPFVYRVIHQDKVEVSIFLLIYFLFIYLPDFSIQIWQDKEFT